MKSFITFLSTMFSESGAVSFSRVITAVIVSFILGWDTSYIVHAMRAHLTPILPDTGTLIGQTTFMTVFYAVNKTAAAFTSSKDGAAPQEK